MNEITSLAAPQTTLYSKLAMVMGEVERIPKNGKNTHFNYSFATEGDISNAIRKLLAEHKIAVFASMTKCGQTKEGNTIKTICDFEFTLACGDTGATHVSTWSGEANDNQDKGINKAATAAMKYWLLKTFMIPTGDDPDGDENPTTGQKSSKKQQVTTTPTQRAQQQAAPQPAEKPATPKNAPTPPAQPHPTTPTAYQIGDLYNAVLKDVYNNIPQHMNASIKKLIDAGALKPDMTLEMAIAAVKNRKTEDNKPVALPPSVAAAQKAAKPVFDGVTPPAPVADDATLRRNTLARLEGEAVTLFRVEKAKYVQGQGKAEGWKWIGHAMITESDGMEHQVEVRLFPEDVDAISRAGHAFPRIDAAVNIDVILHIENDMIRINRDKLAPKDTTPIAASPFSKGKFDPEAQKLWEELPGISDAAKHQLEA